MSLGDFLKRRDVQKKVLLYTSLTSLGLTIFSLILGVLPCFLCMMFLPMDNDACMNYLLMLILMMLDTFLFYELLSLLFALIYLWLKKNFPPPP